MSKLDEIKTRWTDVPRVCRGDGPCDIPWCECCTRACRCDRHYPNPHEPTCQPPAAHSRADITLLVEAVERTRAALFADTGFCVMCGVQGIVAGNYRGPVQHNSDECQAIDDALGLRGREPINEDRDKKGTP